MTNETYPKGSGRISFNIPYAAASWPTTHTRDPGKVSSSIHWRIHDLTTTNRTPPVSWKSSGYRSMTSPWPTKHHHGHRNSSCKHPFSSQWSYMFLFGTRTRSTGYSRVRMLGSRSRRRDDGARGSAPSSRAPEIKQILSRKSCKEAKALFENHVEQV